MHGTCSCCFGQGKREEEKKLCSMCNSLVSVLRSGCYHPQIICMAKLGEKKKRKTTGYNIDCFSLSLSLTHSLSSAEAYKYGGCSSHSHFLSSTTRKKQHESIYWKMTCTLGMHYYYSGENIIILASTSTNPYIPHGKEGRNILWMYSSLSVRIIECFLWMERREKKLIVVACRVKK